MKSKVMLAVVLVFFGVFFNAFQGTREVDRNLLSNARILGASRWQATRQVVLPSAFTWILASLHISFGFALIGAVVGELLGADKGMGLLIRTRRTTSTSNGVLAGMVVIALIALVAEAPDHRCWRSGSCAGGRRSQAVMPASDLDAHLASRGAITRHRHPSMKDRSVTTTSARARHRGRRGGGTGRQRLQQQGVQTNGGLSRGGPDGRQRTRRVTIMVGGLCKQIYLPFMLAKQLGYYAKAGVNVNLIDEPAGGDATKNMLAGQVQGVGGFYDHNIALQALGKSSESVVSMLQIPGEVELCRTDLKGKIKCPADWTGSRSASPTPARRPTS